MLNLVTLQNGGGDPSSLHHVIELQSPNRKHSISLKVAELEKWLSALSTAVDAATAEAVIKANFALPFRIVKMGWMMQVQD